MTAPTPRPSLTPVGALVEKWRERAAFEDASGEKIRRDGWPECEAIGYDKDAKFYRKRADELAAALKAMRCETCVHSGDVDNRRRTVWRGASSTRMVWEGVRRCMLLEQQVPLEINGQPFGCWAHAPRTDGEK